MNPNPFTKRTPYGVVWPEGKPAKARLTYSWIGTQWRCFLMGLGTFFPNPLNARRISWVYAEPTWFGEDIINDAVAMAWEIEGVPGRTRNEVESDEE